MIPDRKIRGQNIARVAVPGRRGGAWVAAPFERYLDGLFYRIIGQYFLKFPFRLGHIPAASCYDPCWGIMCRFLLTFVGG